MTWRLYCGSGKSHALFTLVARRDTDGYHRLNELGVYESAKGFTQILSDDMR
jgi:hypothetical protein